LSIGATHELCSKALSAAILVSWSGELTLPRTLPPLLPAPLLAARLEILSTMLTQH
jgi:hypothetical protein